MGRPAKSSRTLSFPDTAERVQKHLPRGRDLTLVALKGHLLIEAEINELLQSLLPRPNELKRARFTFIQRFRVLAAVSEDDFIPLIAPAIEKLNSLRNALAHRLSVPDEKKLAAEFQNATTDAMIRYGVVLDATAGKGLEKFSLRGFKVAIALTVSIFAYVKRKALDDQPFR